MDKLTKRIVGFSTAQDAFAIKKKPDFSLTDYDIAKQDLINHFMTRKGERLMLPEFGSIIWDLVMEPMVPAIIDMIRYDATRIIQSDERFELISIDVTEYQYGIQLAIVLQYRPVKSVEEFSIKFDKRLADRG